MKMITTHGFPLGMDGKRRGVVRLSLLGSLHALRKQLKSGQGSTYPLNLLVKLPAPTCLRAYEI